MDKTIISPSFLWRTGSINYLWPITLGFLAFYPFLLSIKNKLNKQSYLGWFLFSLFSGILTEQVSVALILIVITYFSYMVINKRKIPTIMYLMFFNMIVGSLILFLAPGNQIRLKAETLNNFPAFLNLGIFNRISISFYWVLNKLVNILSLEMAVIFFILGFKNLKKSTKIISFTALILGFILMIKKISKIEYKVYPITGDNFLNLGILFPYILIILGLFLMIYLIFKKYKVSKKSLIYFLILFLILVLMLMITLSPTMDVSGNRTIFLPNILINILIILLTIG
jgi:hypothetical protein